MNREAPPVPSEPPTTSDAGALQGQTSTTGPEASSVRPTTVWTSRPGSAPASPSCDAAVVGSARAESGSVLSFLLRCALVPGHPRLNGPLHAATLAGTTVATAASGGARSDPFLADLVLAALQGEVVLRRASRPSLDLAALAAYPIPFAALGWRVGTAPMLLRWGLLATVGRGTDLLSQAVGQELGRTVRLSARSRQRAILWRQVARLGRAWMGLDASGPWAQLPKGLASLGYPPAAVTAVELERRTLTPAGSSACRAQSSGIPRRWRATWPTSSFRPGAP